jgi:hypothetical protein
MLSSIPQFLLLGSLDHHGKLKFIFLALSNTKLMIHTNANVIKDCSIILPPFFIVDVL